MTKKIIHTDKAPAAIGPYAQANQIGNMIYTSGQIPVNPEAKNVTEETIEGQTRQVMENLKAVLEAAGANMNQVVKTTCFLTDLGNFAIFNEIYGEYFSENSPARSTIEVAALPLGVLVEVEAVASLD